MKSISAEELQIKIKQATKDFILIDVREGYENEHFNIGGILMPMATVMHNAANIPTDKTVIFYCEKGIRSALVIQRLEDKFGFNNLINLKGGMQAWRSVNLL